MNENEFKPYDIEVEQGLLGAVLSDNRVLAVALATLVPDDFYDPFHARIFERMVIFDEDQRAITDLTLASSIKNDPAKETIDVPSYLYELSIAAPALPDPKAVEEMARIILEHRERRDARQAINEAYQDIYNGDVPLRALAQVIDVADRITLRVQNQRGTGDVDDHFANLARDVEHAAKGGRLPGVSTGLNSLDRQLGGYQPEDLIIVAGRPGMGKSAFACDQAVVAGRENDDHGHRRNDPTIFSLEMSGKENVARMIAELDYDESVALGRTPLKYSDIKKGRLNDDEFERFVLLGQKLQDFGIKVYDEGKMTVAKIGALARARAQLSPRRPFILVDNIQIVGFPEGYRGNRFEGLTEITGGLKALAKRLKCPVIALSHLNRGVETREDKRPNLGDLKESGSIEQDADAVLFLYRPEYYLRTQLKHARATKAKNRDDLEQSYENSKGVLEVDVAKNRAGGTGDVKVFCDIAHNAIREKRPTPGDGAPAQLTLERRLGDPLDYADLEARTGGNA